MALSRRSVTATATLVVYLAGLVGGALHHHAGHGRHAGGDGPGQCIYRPGVFAADHGDNEDGCAVCAAIHQAQAPPLATVVLTLSTPAADVVTANPTEPPLPFHAATRARGPPLF